jgi:monooxygenase
MHDDEETSRMPSDQTTDAERHAITFINRFTVHAPSDMFEKAFAETSAFMMRQPGFVDHVLIRRVDRDNAYVNIARWTDEESFRAALRQKEFQPHAVALRALSTSEHNLYRTCLRGQR